MNNVSLTTCLVDFFELNFVFADAFCLFRLFSHQTSNQERKNKLHLNKESTITVKLIDS